MFGQQRSQSGPGGLSINTGSANLFGSTSSQAPSEAVSKPLFGSSFNTTAASQSGGLFSTPTASQGGLFGTSTTNPGGLLGAQSAQATTSQPQQQDMGLNKPSLSLPQQTGGGLFGSLNQGQQQPAGGSLFGSSIQNQAPSNQQQQPQQQSGSTLFGGLNKPAMFGQSFGQSQQRPTFASQTANATQSQQQQNPQYTASIGQYSQQQQAIPGVRVDLTGLKSTTRFNDLYEEVQKVIENVDNFIATQIHLSDECELAMPKIESAIKYIPSDVEFCSKKLDVFQQTLENDARAISSNKTLVKKDGADARLSFKALENLRMPQHFHHAGLWSVGSVSQHVGPVLNDDQETDGGSADLVSYFTKQANEMDKRLEAFRKNITEVESYLRGVEASTIEQVQRVQFTRGRDGGQRSADDQVRELAAVLREFENGILGVAGKVGGARESVQQTILAERVSGSRRGGLY